MAFILLLNGSSISSYHRKQETELQVNQLRPEHIRNGPYSAFCADDLGVAQRDGFHNFTGRIGHVLCQYADPGVIAYRPPCLRQGRFTEFLILPFSK